MKLKKNLPSLLSTSRIVFVPVLYNFANDASKGLFLLIAFGLFTTDVLDGYLARRYKVVSKTGRKLDAIADYVFYPSFIILTLLLNKEEFIRNWYFVAFPTIIFFIPKIIGMYYLKKFPTLHLHTWRVAGFFLLLWLVVSILFSFNVLMLLITSLFCIIAFFEETAIYLILKEKTDEEVNSIFEVFKD